MTEKEAELGILLSTGVIIFLNFFIFALRNNTLYVLKNFLFGWDYVDTGIRIARVQEGHKDVAFYYYWTNGTEPIIIKNKDSVIWLTCLPEKYMFDVKGFDGFK